MKQFNASADLWKGLELSCTETVKALTAAAKVEGATPEELDVANSIIRDIHAFLEQSVWEEGKLLVPDNYKETIDIAMFTVLSLLRLPSQSLEEAEEKLVAVRGFVLFHQELLGVLYADG